MVLAAGLGTRLRPLTYFVSKPMVPVLERPVMAYILALLERHGFDEVICNLHHFPDPIRSYFGERIDYSFEPELLGTAGGVRGCRDFLGDGTFLVISGDALTDIDLTDLLAAHRAKGGIATLAVKETDDTSQYGVVLHDAERRITGFQEKPPPDQARSNLANCGIYLFEPEIFSFFPDRPFVDFAQDVFPRLLAEGIPFYAHPVDGYWNDIGSLAELRRGSFDALAGLVTLPLAAQPAAGGLLLGGGAQLADDVVCEGRALVGTGAVVGSEARLDGPVVVGPGASVGAGAQLREAVLLPGSQVGEGAVVVGGIVADRLALADPLRFCLPPSYNGL